MEPMEPNKYLLKFSELNSKKPKESLTFLKKVDFLKKYVKFSEPLTKFQSIVNYFDFHSKQFKKFF